MFGCGVIQKGYKMTKRPPLHQLVYNFKAEQNAIFLPHRVRQVENKIIHNIRPKGTRPIVYLDKIVIIHFT